MAFPATPTNGQTAVIANVTYQYANATNTWTRIPGFLSGFTTVGNIVGGNILTTGLVSATGNVTGNYILGNGSLLTGVITSVANISNGTSNVSITAANSNVSVGVAGTDNIVVFSNTGAYVSGIVSATGNIQGNNASFVGAISATGNIQSNGYVLGNGALLTGVITSVANINNGTSNVTVVAANANVTVGINGTGNVAVFANTGAYVTGIVSASGNIFGGGVLSTTATTPPSSPSVGDIWYNSTTSVQYRYTYDGTNYYWVDQTGGSITANAYGNINVASYLTTYNGNIAANSVSGNIISVTGTTSSAALTVPNIKEPVTVMTFTSTGTINYDVTTQSVLYYTLNSTGNFTINFRASSGTTLNSIMSTGDSFSVSFMCTNGTTAYYNSAVTVDGTSVTPKWQGGTAPTSGNASSVDIYNYVILKTGSAAFAVFASVTKFA